MAVCKTLPCKAQHDFSRRVVGRLQTVRVIMAFRPVRVLRAKQRRTVQVHCPPTALKVPLQLGWLPRKLKPQ